MWKPKGFLTFSTLDEWAKRGVDVLLSAVGLAVLVPLFGVIALLIRLDSSGPVLYRGIRTGRWGHPFAMCKFRTMVMHAETLGGASTADDDPRITRIGRLLRKTKLDELPQLINVLRGEMSIVGPRPEVPQYVAMFGKEEQVILTVRPGMTDWASLWDIDEGAVLVGSANAERDYLERIRPQKLRLQLEYVRRRSLRVDLQIIAQTVATVFRRRSRRADSPVEE